MCVESKGNQGLPTVSRGRGKAWRTFSLRVSRRNSPAEIVDSEVLASTTVNEYHSVVLRHPLCGDMLPCTRGIMYYFKCQGGQIGSLAVSQTKIEEKNV